MGGDGVFHEALNGLMAARGSAAATGDAELAALLGALRLAHIPAGSTDAGACGIGPTLAWAGPAASAGTAEDSGSSDRVQLVSAWRPRPLAAVACTLHGTRRAFTAALHVALGDSTPLDVLRVDTPQGPKFASCIAGEGGTARLCDAAECAA